MSAELQFSVKNKQSEQEESLSTANHACVCAAHTLLRIAFTVLQAQDFQCAAGVLMAEKQANITGKLMI